MSGPSGEAMELSYIGQQIQQLGQSIDNIAYEQHTANLMAHLNGLLGSQSVDGPLSDGDLAEAQRVGLEIRKRLGFL